MRSSSGSPQQAQRKPPRDSGSWDAVAPSKVGENTQPNVQGYPTHELLSRTVPDHPVLLDHASGHMVMANAKAMAVRRGRGTPNPCGWRDSARRRGRADRGFSGNYHGAGLHKARSEADEPAHRVAQERNAIRLATPRMPGQRRDKLP